MEKINYKKLIKRLRCNADSYRYKFKKKYGGCVTCSEKAVEDAATAIETLLAERDALIKELGRRPHHTTCKYGNTCGYTSAVTGLPDCKSCYDWEWRGDSNDLS